MKHYGDITKLHGYDLAPVNVITAGSPCQDLSVAGKGAGLAGKRSGLFMEYVRIIKEMRFATYGKYPNYTIWENVPGAFSSNNGEDFRAVLEELARVVEPHRVIPRPPGKGKWQRAGCILGNGWSIAWRVFDAQYWGVPQRRRRIALVMDFRGHTAPQVLFECQGLPGDIAQGAQAWQKIAARIGKGAGGAGANDGCLTPWDVQSRRIYTAQGTWPALYGGEGGGRGYIALGIDDNVLPFDTTQVTSPENGSNPQYGDPCHPLCAKAHPPSVAIDSPAAAFMGNMGAKAHGIGYGEEVSPTLLAGGSSNQVPSVCLPEVARTLTARHDGSYDPGRDNGQNIVTVFEGEDITGTLTARCGTPCPLPAQMANIVLEHEVYDARGNGNGEIAPTLTGDHNRTVSDFTTLCLSGNYVDRETAQNGSGIRQDAAFTLNTIDRHAVVEPTTYQETTGPLMANTHPGGYTGQDAHSDMLVTDPPIICASTGQANAEILADLIPTLNCNHEQPYITRAETSALDCRNLREMGEHYPTLQAKDNGGISLNYSHAVRRGGRVRRLTPLECERLQGYPDGWTDIPTYTKRVVIERGRRKGDMETRVIEVSDAVRYRALGNSIALPPWLAVMYSLSRFLPPGAVMGSLFDGIGGFPLVWQTVYGKGTALWASEIEPFPIAVTKHHFPGEATDV